MFKLKLIKISICIAPALLCCFAALYFGKDVNFDAINYHGYAAFGLMNERLWVDFFPAGPQSYLNPLGYIPFYFLKFYMGDVGVTICLALLHSACIYGVVFFSGILIDKKKNTGSYYFAILLSLVTVVYWQNVGSSFIDAYICAFVIFGLGFLLRWVAGAGSLKELGMSAFLFGLAVGLKLTSVIFAISATLVVFLYLLYRQWNWKEFCTFACMGALGFIITQGWWGYLVYEKTGNPFFPYFNNVFQSAFLPSEGIINTRFIPEGFVNGLIFPLKAILPLPWLYQELRAPDIRWVVFFVSLSVVMIGAAKKVIVVDKVGWGAIVFFVSSYVLWLLSSGNGRYGMPIFLLVGVLVAWLLSLFLKKEILRVVLLLLFIFQAALVFLGGNLRWSDGAFSNTWFDYEVPKTLIDEPALYLTTEHNSYSFLAEKVNPSSIFVNISGQISLPYSEKLDDFFRGAMERVDGNVRVIANALLTESVTQQDDHLPTIGGYFLRPRLLYVLNARLSRFGFEIDEKSCLFISPNSDGYKSFNGLLVSCKLNRSMSALNEYIEVVKDANVVFDLIERSCVEFFSPRSSVTERYGDLVMRNYVGSEAMMYLSAGVVWISFSDRIGVKKLGDFEGLRSGKISVDCNNELLRVSEDIY